MSERHVEMDLNSNYRYFKNQNAKGWPNYTTLTRRVAVPNIIISTLHQEARNSTLSPAQPRRRLDSILKPSPLPVMANKDMAVKRHDKVFKKEAMNVEKVQEPDVSDRSSKREVRSDNDLAASLRKFQNHKPSNPPKIKPMTNSRSVKSIEQKLSNSADEDPEWPLKVARPPTMTPSYKESCCCKRPKKFVWCRFCGYYLEGNIHVQCIEHPQNHLLHAIRGPCPNCKGPNNLFCEQDL